MRRISFQKTDLHFDRWNPGPNRPIFRDIRGQNILPVINAVRSGSTANHHNHENGSTIDIFHNFLSSSDKMEMGSIVVELFFYSSTIASWNNYVLAFQSPNFGKFGRTAPQRSFKLDRFRLKWFQVLSTPFSWIAPPYLFDHCPYNMGQHECLNNEVKLCR